MIQSTEWLLLLASLPTAQSAVRMHVWRTLKARGAAALREGAWLLPLNEENDRALRGLAGEVRAAEGSAEILQVAAAGAQDAAFRALFDRAADYGRLLEAIRAAQANPEPKAAHALRREFRAIAATDHFPGAARTQVEAALTELAAVASGEPRAGTGAIRRLASADFSGRIWATRKNLWVDRMASAWLIRRFIDRKAKLLWLDDPRDCPSDALGFDFDGAAFSHLAATPTTPERVTFEVLTISFGLDADPAIARIGTLVHCLDVGGVPVAEAAGIEAVLAGLRAAAKDDDKLLKEASRIFDGLYKSFSQESNDE